MKKKTPPFCVRFSFKGLKSVPAFLHCPLHVTGAPVGVPAKAPSIPAESVQPFNRLGVLCTACNKVMLKGQTAFQRSGSSKLYCSPACLCNSKTKTCHSCHKYAYDISFNCIVVYCWNELTWSTFFTFREIRDQHNTIIGPVDMLGTVKDFCSQKCFSALNFKCSVCQKTGVVSRLLQLCWRIHRPVGQGIDTNLTIQFKFTSLRFNLIRFDIDS